MNEIIDGSGAFHPHPVGAHIWRCDVCGDAFCWWPESSYWGTIDAAEAVVCSNVCRAKYMPGLRPKRAVVPIGKIGADRMPKGYHWADNPR